MDLQIIPRSFIPPPYNYLYFTILKKGYFMVFYFNVPFDYNMYGMPFQVSASSSYHVKMLPPFIVAILLMMLNPGTRGQSLMQPVSP